MLMIHGNAFAVEAVANLQDETSTHVSAQRGVGAILLGTRALLRLYSTHPPHFLFIFHWSPSSPLLQLRRHTPSFISRTTILAACPRICCPHAPASAISYRR